MSLNFEEVNVLGNLINDTFGKASTNTGYSSVEDDGNPRYGGYASTSASSVATKAR